MRNLSVVPNIGGSSSSYPDGVIIDNASGVTGTALTEMLYGDTIQTVHKLKRLSGITPNGLPDNETNGFQLLRALLEQSIPKWQPPSSNVVFENIQFVTYNNGLYFHKTAVNTTNNPAADTINWAQILYWNGTRIVFADTYSKSEVYNKLEVYNKTETNSISEIDQKDNLRSLKTNVIEKDSTEAYTPIQPTHPVNLAALNSGGTRTAVLNCQLISSSINAGLSSVQAQRIGAFIFISGRISLTSDPSDSPTAFTLPSEIGLAGMDTYISGHDGNGSNSQNTIMKATANSDAIVFLPSEWSTQLMYFSKIVPAKI